MKENIGRFHAIELSEFRSVWSSLRLCSCLERKMLDVSTICPLAHELTHLSITSLTDDPLLLSV